MKKKFISLLMALALYVSCLSACAAAAFDEPEREPWRPPTAPVAEAAAAGPETASEKDSGPAGTDAPETSEKDPAPAPADAPEADEPPVESTQAEPDPDSVQGVARLGDLVGNYAMELFRDQKGEYIVVDTEDSHNPYDLTWRYGPDTKDRRDVYSPDWDELYRAYVDICDWSLVFDAEYYKQAFPMLAKLYHENDALLLKHFQTQGVHEGRQASANFNVAAYMANCGSELVKAFGENYECYYFYYMLNQDTQKSVSAKNSNGAYPRWLALELSLHQSFEYVCVNGYRKEVHADRVELDPEIIALANYRAWTDAEYNLYAHDWTTDTSNAKDINDVLWRVSRNHFAENTTKWYSTSRNVKFTGFQAGYRNSPDHYKAMVSTDYHYFGCSNPYWSDNPDNPFAKDGRTGFACQFDLFTETQTQTPYQLD